MFFPVLIVVLMARRHYSRTSDILSYAKEVELDFCREDEIDLSLKYGFLSFFTCGHSPRISNVVQGIIRNYKSCIFDYCYEVGHGTRRLARRYRVVIFEEIDCDTELLMWSDYDFEAAPLSVRQFFGRFGDWSYTGDSDAAEKIWCKFDDVADLGISFEISSRSISFYLPFVSDDRLALSDFVERCVEVVEELHNTCLEKNISDSVDMKKRCVDE